MAEQQGFAAAPAAGQGYQAQWQQYSHYQHAHDPASAWYYSQQAGYQAPAYQYGQYPYATDGPPTAAPSSAEPSPALPSSDNAPPPPPDYVPDESGPPPPPPGMDSSAPPLPADSSMPSSSGLQEAVSVQQSPASAVGPYPALPQQPMDPTTAASYGANYGAYPDYAAQSYAQQYGNDYSQWYQQPQQQSYSGYDQQWAAYQQPHQQYLPTQQGHGSFPSASAPSAPAAAAWQPAAPPAAGQPYSATGSNQIPVSSRPNRPVTSMASAAPGEDASYNAVPPPASLQPRAGFAAGRGSGKAAALNFSIPRQGLKGKPGGGKLAASSQVTAATAPAYLKVEVSKPAPAATPANPTSTKSASGENKMWPPSLRAYVERAFNSATETTRPALQVALKSIIQDATQKAEIWTRDWDNTPLPLPGRKPQPSPAVLPGRATFPSGYSRPGSETTSLATLRGGPARNERQRGSGKRSRSRSRGRSRSRSWSRSLSRSRSRSSSSWGARYRRDSASHGRSRRRENTAAPGSLRQSPALTSPHKPQKQKQKKKGQKGTPKQGTPKQKNNKWTLNSATAKVDVETAAERGKRARRAGRFGADAIADDVVGMSLGVQPSRKQRLALMMEDAGACEEVDLEQFVVKGTNLSLEKSYFRLTAAPDPATVRPQLVLDKALKRLVGLLREGKENYFYAQDQFKGLRQDLTVQHLRGPLAVAVYEAHARAALEYGDSAEYNQCQAQLGMLYGEGAPGCREEFLAYRILYQTMHARHGERVALLHTLRGVRQQDKSHPAVQHALAVRETLAAGDAARFHRLYVQAPAMGRALMDQAVPATRFRALETFCKAYRPAGVPVAFVARVLGFYRPASAAGSNPQEPDCSSPVIAEADAVEAQTVLQPKQSNPDAGRAAAPDAGTPAETAPAVDQNGASGRASGTNGLRPAGLATESGKDGPLTPRAQVLDGGNGGRSVLEALAGCSQASFPGKHPPLDDEDQGVQACIDWASSCGAVITLPPGGSPAAATLDAKASVALVLPAEVKVAHGDANLAIDDFLKTAMS